MLIFPRFSQLFQQTTWFIYQTRWLLKAITLQMKHMF